MKKNLQVRYYSDVNPQDENMWALQPKHSIDCINWNDFLYCPKVHFKIVHNGKMLYIKFDVTEDYEPRTVCTKDQGPVYQDSCVEFFILDKNGSYHNFEFNSNGICLSAQGEKRENRKQRTKDELSSIIRIPSKTEIIRKTHHWNLVIGIPFVTCELSRGNNYDVNFYKCGDLTTEKHYLSWNKINTLKPDFHRAEYFGTMILE